MKVLIDTNVLVSAALKDRIPEEVILFVVAHADMQWIVSPEIMAEYKEVLRRRKFALPLEIQRKWFDLLDTFTTAVQVDATIDFPRDRQDAKFLACALAVQADFFITGDRDFSQAQKLVNTTIISASLFKKLVCDTL
jgi:putative PIN family toxin of toxin-antitoxin system